MPSVAFHAALLASAAPLLLMIGEALAVPLFLSHIPVLASRNSTSARYSWQAGSGAQLPEGLREIDTNRQ
jgi:hypothetical protein